MGGSVLICAMLTAGAAPVPPVAPAPRLVKPDISLIVIDMVPGGTRVSLVGFRDGNPLPPEPVWTGAPPSDVFFVKKVVKNRYLISDCGTVFDIRDKKFINSEPEGPVGTVLRIDDTKLTYRIESGERDGDYTFEYATGKLTRVGLKEPLIPVSVPRSPDGTRAIDWKDGELILQREGQKPKSLGTGFKAYWKSSEFPVLWLDDNRILTQSGTGKIVTVNLDGKVADVVTIKNLSEDAEVALWRDRAGSIVYVAGEKRFKIDPASKTATPTDSWRGLGHGFEVIYDDKKGYKYRHNGKDIGRYSDQWYQDWPEPPDPAPGYLAVTVGAEGCNRNVHVWSAATGKWVMFKFEIGAYAVGWIK